MEHKLRETWSRAESQIRRSIRELYDDLNRQRELILEGLYRAYAVAQHTDCLWNFVRWK